MKTDPSLRELQRWMKGKILPPARAGSAPAGVELDPGEERMSVYSGGYLARIQEALEEAYPAVRHVLGARSFGDLAKAYAGRHASADFNLSRSGSRLPAFLREYPLTTELPFLPDLALLEWKVAEAFHSFERPPLDPARLAAVPPEEWDRLSFEFQPSVSRIASAWPVLDIWEARARPTQEVEINLINRPQRVLIFRRGFEVRCELLERPEEAALEALLAGKTLGELAELGAFDPTWFSRFAPLVSSIIVR